jgi:hypothetical protein
VQNCDRSVGKAFMLVGAPEAHNLLTRVMRMISVERH